MEFILHVTYVLVAAGKQRYYLLGLESGCTSLILYIVCHRSMINSFAFC